MNIVIVGLIIGIIVVLVVGHEIAKQRIAFENRPEHRQVALEVASSVHQIYREQVAEIATSLEGIARETATNVQQFSRVAIDQGLENLECHLEQVSGADPHALRKRLEMRRGMREELLRGLEESQPRLSANVQERVTAIRDWRDRTINHLDAIYAEHVTSLEVTARSTSAKATLFLRLKKTQERFCQQYMRAMRAAPVF